MAISPTILYPWNNVLLTEISIFFNKQTKIKSGLNLLKKETTSFQIHFPFNEQTNGLIQKLTDPAYGKLIQQVIRLNGKPNVYPFDKIQRG